MDGYSRLSQIILVFGSGLIGGYLLEFIYRSTMNKRIQKPLFINAQMYGTSALFMYFLSFSTMLIILRLILIMTFPIAVELLVGYSYLKIRGIRLWDYSSYSFNYRGYICLRFAIYWTVLALIYYYFILPLLVSNVYFF